MHKIRKALVQMNSMIQDVQGGWLIGGSCGLYLRGLKLEKQPRDIDVYTDEPYVKPLAERMQSCMVTPPHYSETPIYRSTLSHYLVNGIQVELVSDFYIDAADSSYHVEVSQLLAAYSLEVARWGMTFKLMPLAHEFVFNLLRNRADRFELIAQEIRNDPKQHRPALLEIIERNKFSSRHLQMMDQLC